MHGPLNVKYCTIVFSQLLSCFDYTNSHRRLVPSPYNDEIYRDQTSAMCNWTPSEYTYGFSGRRTPKSLTPSYTPVLYP